MQPSFKNQQNGNILYSLGERDSEWVCQPNYFGINVIQILGMQFYPLIASTYIFTEILFQWSLWLTINSRKMQALRL